MLPINILEDILRHLVEKTPITIKEIDALTPYISTLDRHTETKLEATNIDSKLYDRTWYAMKDTPYSGRFIETKSYYKVDNTFYGKRIEYFAKKLNIFISHNSDGKINRMSYREADNDDQYKFSMEVAYLSDTDIKIYMWNMYHYLCNICIKELKIVNIELNFPNVEDFGNLVKICNGEILYKNNKLICETTFANIYKIAKIIRKKYQH